MVSETISILSDPSQYIISNTSTFCWIVSLRLASKNPANLTEHDSIQDIFNKIVTSGNLGNTVGPNIPFYEIYV